MSEEEKQQTKRMPQQYFRGRKAQRLVQQKEYRSNMSEEEIKNNWIKHTKYTRSKYREMMRDTEEQLDSPTRTRSAETAKICK